MGAVGEGFAGGAEDLGCVGDEEGGLKVLVRGVKGEGVAVRGGCARG